MAAEATPRASPLADSRFIMPQLLVHAPDRRTGRLGPAYIVCVADGRAFVEPVEDGWEDVARRIETGLNLALAQASPVRPALPQAAAAAVELPPRR